jgi:hypothetical protein
MAEKLKIIKVETTLRFEGLPSAREMPNKKVKVQLPQADGTIFTVILSTRSWRRAKVSAAEFANWSGLITSEDLSKDRHGWRLSEAGVKILETEVKPSTAEIEPVEIVEVIEPVEAVEPIEIEPKVLKVDTKIRFAGLPKAKPMPDKKVKVQLTREEDGVVFSAFLNAKTWRKAEADAKAFKHWVGVISGRFGTNEQEAELMEAGVKIYEMESLPPKKEQEELVTES